MIERSLHTQGGGRISHRSPPRPSRRHSLARREIPTPVNEFVELFVI